MERKTENIIVKIITKTEDLLSIKDFWRQLQQHPYSDFDYYLLSSKFENRFINPYVIILYQGNKPITLLIGVLRSVKINWKIGYYTPCKSKIKSIDICYRGLLGELSEKNCRILVETVLESLRNGYADTCFIDHLNINSLFYDAVKKIPKWYSRDNTNYNNPHWNLFLTDSFQKFYKQRSKNTKSNIRKYKNRITKKFEKDAVIKFYSGIEDISSAVKNIETVAQKTYQRSLGAGFINNEETLIKWEFLAKHNMLLSTVLFIHNKPIAYWNWILYKKVSFSIATGFDPEYKYYHPGQYLLLSCIQHFCESTDCEKIDYGFGEAQYKKMFGTNMWLESPINIFAPNIKGIKLKLLKMFTAGFSQFAISILEKTNILNFVKRSWRKKLSSK